MRTVFRLGLLLTAPVALALQSANVDAQTQGALSPSYSQTLALKKAHRRLLASSTMDQICISCRSSPAAPPRI
jgi:hypothetical protein